jgi:hypothetical protein
VLGAPGRAPLTYSLLVAAISFAPISAVQRC